MHRLFSDKELCMVLLYHIKKLIVSVLVIGDGSVRIRFFPAKHWSRSLRNSVRRWSDRRLSKGSIRDFFRTKMLSNSRFYERKNPPGIEKSYFRLSRMDIYIQERRIYLEKEIRQGRNSCGHLSMDSLHQCFFYDFVFYRSAVYEDTDVFGCSEMQ